MKTRTGFVSNSSSSSFIVSFSEDPANIVNLRDMMKGCGQEEYTYGAMTEEEVIQRVFDDAIRKGPATADEIQHQLGSDLYWEVSQEVAHNDYRDAGGNMDWDSYDAARKVVEAKILGPKMKNFMTENKNKYVYIFEYADDDGEACLEHGDIFSGIPNIRISHH